MRCSTTWTVHGPAHDALLGEAVGVVRNEPHDVGLAGGGGRAERQHSAQVRGLHQVVRGADSHDGGRGGAPRADGSAGASAGHDPAVCAGAALAAVEGWLLCSSGCFRFHLTFFLIYHSALDRPSRAVQEACHRRSIASPHHRNCGPRGVPSARHASPHHRNNPALSLNLSVPRLPLISSHLTLSGLCRSEPSSPPNSPPACWDTAS